MRMTLARRAAPLLLVALLAGPAAPRAAQAADQPSLAIAGAVQHEGTVTAGDLKAMPPIEADVDFMTEHGARHGHYRGVPLWAIIEHAGGISDTAHAAALHHTLVVTARDGYWIVIALGEIDPEFGGRPAMIAYERDGAALDEKDGLRLVVPGDKRGGRSVRDVIKIEVK